MDFLLLKKGDDYWEYDGSYRVYEAIFPYLEKSQIKKILNKIIKGYFERDGIESKLYYISNNIDYFNYCYYTTQQSENNAIAALEQILEMHILCLTGNGLIPFKERYKIKEGIEQKLPSNWIDLVDGIKDRILKI